jgi:hypothetical protein
LIKGFAVVAQGTALEAGYKYNDKNYVQLGLSHRFHIMKDKDKPLNVNICFLTNFHNSLPLVGFQKRFEKGYEIGLNTTNKYVEPVLGINCLKLAKVHLGYSVPFGSNTFSIL